MNEQQILARQDLSDEMRIQFAIDEFYETIKISDKDTDRITQVKLMRNNIVNMMDTYLKKFQNSIIMKDFYERLKKAKNNAITGTTLNKYVQFMNEIRVIQEFKGIQENISDKLAEQLFEQWEEWEGEHNV